MPFARSYKWCPKSVTVECNCGQRLIFKASTALTSFKALCQCGVELIADIQEECQRHQPEVLGQTLERCETPHHPWLYDALAQEEQHLRDEAAYSKDSPLRYNDITSNNMDEE